MLNYNRPKQYKMESIILIGGGGHCKSCIDVIEQEGRFNIAGIVEKDNGRDEKILGYPIIGCDDDLPELIAKYKNVLITVGQIKSANVRMKLFSICSDLNAALPVIISPVAYVSRYTILGKGSIIMHHAVVNAEANIGVNNIINSKALIEHEVRIGNHCHISTGSRINGQVSIADECFIGSGVTLANNITISEKVIIPAGTTVFKNINKSGIYVKL